MAARETSNIFLQWWKKKSSADEGNPPGRHDQSRILDIERDQRAALTQRADRLFSSQRDRGHSVLERPGFFVQHDGLPSPQPPATPRGPISDLPPLNMKENKRGRVPRVEQLWDKEDLFFEKKLRVGSQLAVVACGMAKLTAKYRSPSPDSSVSSVDTHTPSELRAISQIGNFTPTPPSTPKSRRPTRLPVMSGRLCKSGKDGAGEYHLQSVKAKVEEIVDRLQQYQFVPRPSPRPPAAPRRTPAVAPKAPKPRRLLPRPTKEDLGGGQTSALKRLTIKQDELRGLANLSDSPSLCCKQLSSDD